MAALLRACAPPCSPAQPRCVLLCFSFSWLAFCSPHLDIPLPQTLSASCFLATNRGLVSLFACSMATDIVWTASLAVAGRAAPSPPPCLVGADTFASESGSRGPGLLHPRSSSLCLLFGSVPLVFSVPCFVCEVKHMPPSLDPSVSRLLLPPATPVSQCNNQSVVSGNLY